MNCTNLFLIWQRLDLRTSTKYVAPQDLSIYYTWKNIIQQCKNNKLIIIAPTWNNESELPYGSYPVSDIQDYAKYIIKNKNHYPLMLLFIFTSTGLIID